MKSQVVSLIFSFESLLVLVPWPPFVAAPFSTGQRSAACCLAAKGAGLKLMSLKGMKTLPVKVDNLFPALEAKLMKCCANEVLQQDAFFWSQSHTC